ncbi:MAG: hypothetical protein HQL96_08470 [Magnetococcales bacterium]|nr:hypothetical protein [Magnetococcales bacterium]
MPQTNTVSPTDANDDLLLDDPQIVMRQMQILSDNPGMRQLIDQGLSNSEIEVMEMCERSFQSLAADTKLKEIRL